MVEYEGQEPNAEETQEVSQQHQAADAATAAAQEAEEQYDAAYVRKLRAEAAEYRRKLRELEAALKKREEAELSEVERVRGRLAEVERERIELERKMREHTTRYEVMLRAREMGIVDPDAAWRLIDVAEIEFDEDGRPTNLDRLLQGLVRRRPYLLGSASTSATNPPRSQVSLEEAIRSGDLSAINRAFEALLAQGQANGR